jgi:hypothetical protein
MKIICAWCNKVLEDSLQGELSNSGVSHGICLTCRDHFLGYCYPTLAEYLERLEAPILLVDADVNLLYANQEARQLLGKDLDDLQGFRGGEALECAYARLPGGCGSTIHCRECTIRRNVTETYQTGKALRQVPAYLNKQTPEGIQTLDLLISTEKVDHIVVVRIDVAR